MRGFIIKKPAVRPEICMNTTRKLGIAILTSEFVTEPYFSGGVAQHFYRIAKYLAEQGHRVHVITRSHETGHFDYQDLKIYRICISANGIGSRTLKTVTFHKADATVDHLRFSFACLQRVRSLLHTEPIDIIHCFNSHGAGLCSLALPIPQLVTVSCYRPLLNRVAGTTRNLDTWLDERLETLYYRLSKHIYSPSIVLQKILYDALGKKNIPIIRTPFYLETEAQDDAVYTDYLKDKRYILFFGRLQKLKGVHVLGEALPSVFDRCPDLHAVFIGLDDLSPSGTSMRDYIRSLNSHYNNRLLFLDPLPHDQLYPVISHARMVILPSLIDNLPNALLEAMGLGRPVIGTRGCSFDEMIEDGVSGFLVAPGDAQKLAEKIIAVWRYSDKQLSAIGRAASRKIEDLAPSQTVEAVVDYYLHIINSGQAH